MHSRIPVEWMSKRTLFYLFSCTQKDWGELQDVCVNPSFPFTSLSLVSKIWPKKTIVHVYPHVNYQQLPYDRCITLIRLCRYRYLRNLGRRLICRGSSIHVKMFMFKSSLSYIKEIFQMMIISHFKCISLVCSIFFFFTRTSHFLPTYSLLIFGSVHL